MSIELGSSPTKQKRRLMVEITKDAHHSRGSAFNGLDGTYTKKKQQINQNQNQKKAKTLIIVETQKFQSGEKKDLNFQACHRARKAR